MNDPTQASRRMRADAQRNYASLLSAARAAVAEHGGDIVLEDIARSAGVAIGTLYRHFPTRQELLEAVFLDETNELRVRAEKLADASVPLDALVSWLRLQMDFAARGRSMGAAVMAAKHVQGTRIHAANEAMREAGEVLLHRAQAAGAVRMEVDLVDVLRLVYGIVLANEHASDPHRAERMLDLVIAGITT
jgi:AcrR family transcriptional regulator